MIKIFLLEPAQFTIAQQATLSHIFSYLVFAPLMALIICIGVLFPIMSDAEGAEAIVYTGGSPSGINDGDYIAVPAGRPFAITLHGGHSELGCAELGINCEQEVSLVIYPFDDAIVGYVDKDEKTLVWFPAIEDIGVHQVVITASAWRRSCWWFSDDYGRIPAYRCEDADYYINEFSVTKTIFIDIVVHDLSVHSIEPTQAIQVEQSPAELAQYLLDNEYKPPVPLVADKPLTLRVIPNKVTKQTKAVIEVWTSGPGETIADAELAQSKIVLLSPRCSPEERRERKPDPPATCNSINFHLEEGPPVGKSTIWVYLKYPPPQEGGKAIIADSQAELNYDILQQLALEPENTWQLVNDSPDGSNYLDGSIVNFDDSHRFSFDVKASDEIVLRPVNMCLSFDNSRCVRKPVSDLKRGIELLRKIAPTHSVTVEKSPVALNKIRLPVVLDMFADGDGDECDCFDLLGNKTREGVGDCDAVSAVIRPGTARCEAGGWWDEALLRIKKLFELSGVQNLAPGIQNYSYGLVAPDINLMSQVLGMAVGIPGVAAIGHTTGGPLALELTDVQETLAHEVGHLLDRQHTAKALPGGDCIDSFANSPDWPYDDNKIQSGDPFPIGAPPQSEVGFDTERKAVVKPVDAVYDVMSYCSPYWIAPFTYDKLLIEVESAPVDLFISPAQLFREADPQRLDGIFWLVSGFIDTVGLSAQLEPLFKFNTLGVTESGTGSHRIEVRDDTGAVLFTRYFTPTESVAKVPPPGGKRAGPPVFAELVPVDISAQQIVVLDSMNNVLAQIVLGGGSPVVSIITPAGGETWGGVHTVSWMITDADSTSHTSWLEYSADGGLSWQTLAQSLTVGEIDIDFADFSGSIGDALLRVTSSDGSNTGTAISASFSVPKKLPDAEILAPEQDDVLVSGGPAFLKGFGYDLDDGVLPDEQTQWESDIDGIIDMGAEISTRVLSAGNHVLSFYAMDSDGNVASDSVTVTVEPEVLFEEPLDTDNDGFADTSDNCIEASNPDQRDTDSDGFGNACDADLNNDNFVNSLDLGLFKIAIMSTGPVDADFNGDEIVNSLDIGLFKQMFFQPPGPSGLVE